MKKIFAFILATIMVLSLVPASAFAAVSNCPNVHTVKDCEAMGIGYTQIGEPVKPSCEKEGYTAYQCDECGVRFVSDFTPATGHKWISTADSIHIDEDATCDKPGKAWQVCAVCQTPGEKPCDLADCDDANCKKGYNVVPAEHKLSPIALSGVGCELQYGCSVCDEVFYYDAANKKYVNVKEGGPAHDWKFDSVIEEPAWSNGTTSNGKAKFVCKRKGCEGVKTVEIMNPSCKHYTLTDNKIQDYLAPTCFADGYMAVYECVDCAARFVDKDGDGDIDGGLVTDKNKPTTDLKYSKIAKLKHEAKAGTITETKNCKYTYVCKHCGTTQVVVDHTGDINFTDRNVPATCLTPGMTFNYCVDCNTDYSEAIPATGHKACKDDQAIVIEATCQNPGGKYYWCVNPNCDGIKVPFYDYKTGFASGNAPVVYTDKYIVEIKESKPIDSSKHKIVYTVGVDTYTNADDLPDADCTTSQLIIQKCQYGCSTYNYEVDYRPATGHDPLVTQVSYNCLRNIPATEKFGNLMKKEVATCKTCGIFMEDIITPVGITTEFATIEEAGLYHGMYFYNPQVEGDAAYTLRGECVLTAVDKLVPGAYKAPTCLATGYQKYQCSGCALPVFVTIPKVDHSEKTGTWDAGTASDCTTKTKGEWAHFTCKDCGQLVIDTYATIGDSVLNDDKFDRYVVVSGESALVTNPCVSNLEYKMCSGADCEKVGFWQCSECDATYADYFAKEKFVVGDNHKWVVRSEGKVATCNEDGTLEVKYCSACNRLEINQYFADGTVKAYASSGASITKRNTKKDVEYKIKVRKDADELTEKKLKLKKNGTLDTGAATKAALVVPMLSHAKALTANPDVSYTNKNSLFVEINKQGKGKDHTTAVFTNYECSACKYEFLTDYVAASGDHENKYGQILTNECTNGIIDRVCIHCPAGNNIIEADHQNVVREAPVPATCVSDGYTFWYCLDCGYSQVDDLTLKSDDYHDTWEFMWSDYCHIEGEPTNYASTGYDYKVTCLLCNTVLEDGEDAEAVKEAGLELLMNVDSEEYTLGSIVYLTVSLASLKGVDVWGLNFNIDYNPYALQFLGEAENIDWVTESFTDFHAAAQVTAKQPVKDSVTGATTWYDVPTGRVKVAANAREDVLVKGTEDLVVLAFKVIADVNVNFSINAYDEIVTTWEDTDENGDPYYYDEYSYVETLEVINEKGQDVKTFYSTYRNVDLENGKNNYKANKGTFTGAYVRSLLDFNGDGEVTISDIRDIYLLIVTNEYDITADVNYDGAIDMMNDLTKAYEVLVGQTTVEEIAGVLPADWYPGMGARND